MKHIFIIKEKSISQQALLQLTPVQLPLMSTMLNLTEAKKIVGYFEVYRPHYRILTRINGTYKPINGHIKLTH